MNEEYEMKSIYKVEGVDKHYHSIACFFYELEEALAYAQKVQDDGACVDIKEFFMEY